jgi:hypothetical protein
MVNQTIFQKKDRFAENEINCKSILIMILFKKHFNLNKLETSSRKKRLFEIIFGGKKGAFFNINLI